MSTDQETRNERAYHHFHDAINSGDLKVIVKAIDERIHPDALFHTGPGVDAPAIPGQKRVWEILLGAFPDLQVSLDDLITAGDKVVARQTVTGTNTGEYLGMPATGKTVTYNEIFIARFVEGLVIDIWGVADLYSQLQQLGVVPAQRLG